MMTTNKSYSHQNDVSYYTNNLEREGDYYVDGIIKTMWFGRLAERLSLNNELVTKENFKALVSGHDPKSNEKLRVRQVSNAISSIDFTFSASKSVSVLFAITKDRSVLDAHNDAVHQTILAMQEHVETQQNTNYGRDTEVTKELIAASFQHLTARPVELRLGGEKHYIQDPQIHTHTILPAITYSKSKHRYQAIELHAIMSQSRYWENHYHSLLAHGLTKAGFSIKATKNRFEVDGISKDVIDRFSGRTKEIEKAARDKQITDAAEKAKLGVLTRHTKGKGLNENELYDHWKNRLSPSEFDTINSLKNKSNKREIMSVKEVVDRSIAHHEERLSAFKKRDVMAYALKLSYGSLVPSDIHKEIQGRKDLVHADISNVPYVTTKRLIKEEQSLVNKAVAGKGQYTAINRYYSPKEDFLNDQQKSAIREVLQSKDMIVSLHGSAGTGKSTILKNIDEAHKQVGKQTIAIAPSSQATSVLKANGFKNANTIAGFLKDKKKHEIYGKTVIVDEAGMVGIPVLNEIVNLVASKKGRLLMVGDTHQHAPPAQRGEGLRVLQDQAKIQTVRVSRIVRQKHEDHRLAVELLAKSKTLKGYKKLDQMGAIKAVPDQKERLDQISDDYLKVVKAKKTAIIVSPTHKENDEINNVIRENLKAQKLLNGREKHFPSYRNLSFTADEKRDLSNYSEGQVIRFINNASNNHPSGYYKAGQAYEVMQAKSEAQWAIKNLNNGQIQELPVELNQSYEVYAQRNLPISVGERIKLTQNTKTLEGTKANNGTSYEIKGFTRSGDLKLSSGKTLKKDTGHWRYAYCDTSHAAQGRDADFAFVSISEHSFSTASREQLYVSVSRGKYGVKLYTSDKARLEQSIKKSEHRISAQDIKKREIKQQRERTQVAHHRAINQKMREHEQQRREINAHTPVQSKSPNPNGRE